MYVAHIFCILALLSFDENTEAMPRLSGVELHRDSLSWLDELQDKQVRYLYSSHVVFFETLLLGLTERFI